MQKKKPPQLFSILAVVMSRFLVALFSEFGLHGRESLFGG